MRNTKYKTQPENKKKTTCKQKKKYIKVFAINTLEDC